LTGADSVGYAATNAVFVHSGKPVLAAQPEITPNKAEAFTRASKNLNLKNLVHFILFYGSQNYCTWQF
jgi:hypothetical protein